MNYRKELMQFYVAPTVTTWLADIQEDMEKFETDILKVGCFSLISRYSLSKKVKKTSKTIKEFREREFANDQISVPRPPPSIVPSSSREMEEYVSRKQVEENILKFLKHNKGKTIGIHGMEGVGKTTMAKKIKDRVMAERLFEEVIFVVVGQSVDILQIQVEMAGLLGFEERLKSTDSKATRVEYMKKRLTSKSILIILYDVREKLNLEDKGISSQNCTILLTSRDSIVFMGMDAKTFGVDVLPEEEAWLMFKNCVGDCADDPFLVSIAKDIVNECKGLPVAIVTVGVSLKDAGKAIWEDSLDQLQSPNPRDMWETLKEVYMPLCLSYDRLGNSSTRLLLLLCFLYPEDSNINLDDLTSFVVGLNMFEEIKIVDKTRSRVGSLVDMLKSRSLLLDDKSRHEDDISSETHVLMHDVTRDVARFIALEEGKIATSLTREQKWVLIQNQSSDDLLLSNFSSLQLLLVDGPKSEELPTLERIECLKVLSLNRLYSTKPPQAIHLLKDLRTLEFWECMSIDDISFVGDLSSLEIFKCVSCKNIK